MKKLLFVVMFVFLAVAGVAVQADRYSDLATEKAQAYSALQSASARRDAKGVQDAQAYLSYVNSELQKIGVDPATVSVVPPVAPPPAAPQPSSAVLAVSSTGWGIKAFSDVFSMSFGAALLWAVLILIIWGAYKGIKGYGTIEGTSRLVKIFKKYNFKIWGTVGGRTRFKVESKP